MHNDRPVNRGQLMNRIFVNPPKLIFSLIWARALLSCVLIKKHQLDKDKISKQDELYFKASEQSKFEAKIAEDVKKLKSSEVGTEYVQKHLDWKTVLSQHL